MPRLLKGRIRIQTDDMAALRDIVEAIAQSPVIRKPYPIAVTSLNGMRLIAGEVSLLQLVEGGVELFLTDEMAAEASA